MKLLLASAPSNYGKGHNVVYCYAYFFTFLTSQKANDDLWIF